MRTGCSRRIGAAVCLIAFQGLALASDPWAPPPSYYAGATGAGATLKSELYDIMRTGHLQRSYGDYRYSAAITDADPNHPGNIILIYNDASVSASWDSGATWNREHVWPQSLQPGDASNSTTGNLGDPHALRPANPSINSSRGNKPYGFDATTGVYGSQGSYYFPGDTDKGDIARTLMYSDTRWGPEKGLSLVDTVPSTNQMGDLSSIIAWNYLDPPSEFERRRNHAIYSSALNPSYYTNNRNAYVDHPEFVWSIYMDQNNDSQLSVAAPNADGSSETTITLPPVFVGATLSTAAVTVNKSGFDGTYFAVTTTADAWSSASDTANAFPILNAPLMADAAAIQVGIDPASTSTPGTYSGTVIIDNLDVTTGAGLGFAAQDADDVVHVTGAVYHHAEGSFDSPANIDALAHDFGTLPIGATATFSFPVYNLESAAPAGDLWIVPGVATGDAAAFDLDLIDASVAAGASETLTVTLDTSIAGTYSATLEIIAADDPALAGAITGDSLVLTLTATVGAGCPADLDASGTLNLDDVNLFANAFAAGNLLADVDGNGVLNLDDVNTFALSFVAGCP